MRLFEHRPLCKLLSVFLVGILLFGALPFPILRVLFFIFLGAGAIALSLALCLKAKKRMFRGILFFALALSVASGTLFFYQWRQTSSVEPYADREIAVRVEVEEISFSSAYETCFTGRLILADGKAVSIPVAGEVAWLEEAKAGDVIEGVARLYPLSAHREEDAAYYEAGCFGLLQDFTDAEVVDTFSSPKLFFRALRANLTARICEAAGEEGGGLLSALLIGDKSLLSKTVLRDFSRLGISHMLALSGLHLSVISLSLDRGLSKLRVHRKARAALGIVAALFYMLLTGFSPSVSRAGIMLIFYLSCFLLGENHDGMTALFASVSFLCILQPYQLYELSLWLSAAATFGILVLSDWRIKQRDGLPPMPSPAKKHPKALLLLRRLGKLMLDNVAISCAATVATLPIVAFFFSEFSWISLLSNLLLSLPVVLLIRLSFVAAIFGGSIPWLGSAISFLCEGLLSLVRAMAGIPGLLISINAPFYTVLLLLTAAAVLGLLIRHPKAKKPVLATLLLGALLLGGGVVTEKILQASTTSAKYLSHKNGGYIAIESGNTLLLYDASSSTYAERSAALDWMREAGRTEIDHYVLSHYSHRVESNLADIVAKRNVRMLHLALPQTEAEEARYQNVIALAEEWQIPYETYAESTLSLGELSLRFLPSATVYSSTQPVFGFYLDGPAKDLTFVSPAYHRSYAHEEAAAFLEKSHVLLIGGQGGDGGYVDFAAEMPLLETVVIASSEKAEIPPGGNLSSTDAEFLQDGSYYPFDLG